MPRLCASMPCSQNRAVSWQVLRRWRSCSQCAAARADADHGDQPSPFVSLLKEYMARAPAPLAAATAGSAADGRGGSEAGTSGAAGSNADALMHAASQAAHRLLELAARAAERQVQTPASSGGVAVPSGAPAAVQAAADESWQVRPCLGLPLCSRLSSALKAAAALVSVAASWLCAECDLL